MKDISKNIREARIKRGLTQDEMAGQLFVTRQTVSNYENGKSRPDIDMLEQIAEITGTNLNELIYGLEKKAGPKRAISITAIITGMVFILSELAKSVLLLVSHTKYALQEGMIAPEEAAKSTLHFKLIEVAGIIDRYLIIFVVAGFIAMFILCFFMKKPISWKKKVIYTALLLATGFLILIVFSAVDPLYPFIEYALPMFSLSGVVIIWLILSVICDGIRSRKMKPSV